MQALLQAGNWNDRRWILSCVTRNASEAGYHPVFLVSDNVERAIDDAPRPTPIEIMDRLLLWFARRKTRAGDISGAAEVRVDDRYLFFVKTPDDLAYALRGLARQGYVEHISAHVDASLLHAELTVDGWKRVAQLEESTVRSWQAFVAMWFSEDTTDAFEQGIKAALVATGYRPVRIDRVHHNDKIDDRIIAEIRRSGLVVADFTGQRGGVYFEAGFARGLGIPVIWSCRKDWLEKGHFDTRQFNHVVWSTAAELREQLTDRIRATLAYRDNANVDGVSEGVSESTSVGR